ncbi:MAG: LysR family transcriptional regulator [Herbinix sp.]|jgi:DNA-binding transcriptional LysR family regulator|nr:LysR family transcriptional regulator [Herbinix sp.]
MELLQLKYFCEIAKQENITKAAGSLHVSQPSLSRTLSSLEAELGVSLFDRTGKYIRLNHHGRQYYEKIQEGLRLIDDAGLALKDSLNEPCGHINVLVLAASNVVPDLFIHFYKAYPNITLNLKQQSTHNILQAGDFDFAISATPADYTGLTNIKLMTEDLVLAVHVNHPLAKEREIELIDAAPYNFVTYSVGPSIRTLSDSLWLQAGFKPKIILESDSPSTYKLFIQSQMGIALLPYQTQRSLFSPMVIPIRIKYPACNRVINLSYPKNHYINRAGQLFIDFCVDFFAKIASNNHIL